MFGTVSIDFKSSWANETVERITERIKERERERIKKCQENQILRFNPSNYIEEINKEEEKKFVMVKIFISRNCFIYECRTK